MYYVYIVHCCGHHTEVKEESRLPSITTKSSSSATTKSSSTVVNPKCKVYLTMDSTVIRTFEGIDFDSSPRQGALKHQKTGASQSQFNGVVVTTLGTRISSHATRMNSKWDMCELLQRLGQELKAVGKTFEELATVWE